MSEAESNPGSERRNGRLRRRDAERRVSTLDALAPVSLDGAVPVQRRSGRERRTAAADRRVEPPRLGARDARALVFPGQGSQAVGMGSELGRAFRAARLVFEEVDDALSQNLSHLMAEGPAEELTLTENAQPALLAVSMATLRVLESEGGVRITDLCRFAAGHSLGEYTALTAAGSFTVVEAVRLLKTRGRAMQAAVTPGQGTMAALIGLQEGAAQEAIEEVQRDLSHGECCVIANDNAPGQIVLSGTREAVQRAIDIARTLGAKRSVLLPVSAPFHSPLMGPAADALAEVLDRTSVRPPLLPVLSNVSARPETDPERIAQLLVSQVTGTVRWRESVLWMCEHGIDTLVELGCGRVLCGLGQRIDRAMSVVPVSTPPDVEAVLAALREGSP